MKKKIYIASPYTLGDIGANIKAQMDATEELYKLGFAVYAPVVHMHFQHIAYQHDWNFWMSQCYEWLEVCDAVLRLKGVSEGADLEMKYAESKGIPVFRSIVDLEYYFKNKNV